MLTIDPLAPLPAACRNAVVAIGNFDGMHRGHQELLRVAASEARSAGRPWGIVTFEPHPRTYFKPDEPVFRLTPPELKGRLAAALGAAFIMHLPFDRELSSLEPDAFVARHLVERMQVSHVVTGYDFHFGKGRKGNPTTLQAAGEREGFAVTIVDQVSDDGDGQSPFSSSSIRTSLRRGHVEAASRELGYRWMVMGEVVHGDKRGRTIGFPTLNIVLERGAEPFRGIYAVRVRDANERGEPCWQGAGYFGDRPTFDSPRTFLEVYLLDMSMDLYGRTLIVEFVDLIRPDKRFSGIDELVTQMRVDCDAARTVLKALEENDPLGAYPLAQAQAKGLL